MAGEVWTVAELADAAAGEPPARLAVCGWPVKHSRSPQMHNPALAARGIAARYIRLEVPPEDFPAALTRMAELGFIGTNCTIPHKFAALEAVDVVDDLAARLGAVNTIAFRDGKRFGYNSDGPGLLRAVRETLGVEIATQRTLIIGAGGGAGRAAAIKAALVGSPHLVLTNRTLAKAETVACEIAEFYPASQITVTDAPDFSAVDLIVNATSLGMKPDDAPVIPTGVLTTRHCVYDMVYSPPQTALLQVAEAAGARAANGLSMLLHQGAVSFEHWFGGTAPLEVMRTGLLNS